MGCIYTESKNYPREPAAHVAISENYLIYVYGCSVSMYYNCASGHFVIYYVFGNSLVHRVSIFNSPNLILYYLGLGTVRRFLEKQEDQIKAIVFCTTTSADTEIYKRFP